MTVFCIVLDDILRKIRDLRHGDDLRDRLFAMALDEAELRKVRTPLPKRKRQPQVGLSLVLALPHPPRFR